MSSRLITTLVLAIVGAAPAVAEVMTSELVDGPLVEEWTAGGQWGELTSWTDNGVYYQDFPHNCEPGPVCASQSLWRSIAEFNDRPNWFYEYRVSATGDHNEIQNGAPTVLGTGNSMGNLYHATLASDEVKLSGDGDIPFLFHPVGPGPHTIRLELFNDPPPAMFHWYVDSVLVLKDLADGPFPDFDSRITWTGRTWQQPTSNAWYYIRAGDIPVAASGDFNSAFDSVLQVDEFDFGYFVECFERSNSEDEPAFPSCAWADMDGDDDVDCDDWFGGDEFDGFRDVWTGPGDVPDFDLCVAPPAPRIPFSPHRAAKSFIATPPPPGDDVEPGEGGSAIGD